MTYLERLRAQHGEIRSRITAKLDEVAKADRDLTEDELRSVREDRVKADALAEEIEQVHASELRAAKVAGLAPIEAPKADADNDGDQHRSRVHTQDRDPGHYRSTSEGGQHSFFSDLYRSRQGDERASRRLTEHNRALSVGSGAGNTIASGGIVPPKWLSDMYLPLSRQGRVLAAQATPLELGDDPRPVVLPRQTAGTDSVVGDQAEGQAVNGADAFDTTTETLTPTAVAGKQTVTRQLVDSATPAVDQLIYTDLISVYNSQIEKKVANALVTAAGAPAVTFALEADFAAVSATTGVAASNAVIDAQTDVWESIFQPAELIAVSPRRWGALRKLVDLQGRPIVTRYDAAGARGRADGAAVNGLVGEWEGLPVFATTALGTTGYPNDLLVSRVSDAILAESNLMQFRFEEVQGPEDIVLGIWRYAGVLVRRGGAGTKKIEVTQAA